MIEKIKKTVLNITQNFQKAERKVEEVRSIWERSVGKEIAENSRLVKFKNQTLFIKTTTPT